MLKSEQSSNNEESDSTNLLSLGKQDLLSFEKEKEIFHLTQEEATIALSSSFDLFEGQALQYFSGYIYKILIKFHAGKVCNVCQNYVGSVSQDTTDIEEHEIFTLLKRYEGKAVLYPHDHQFDCLIGGIARIVNYCCKKYLKSPCFLESVQLAARQHVLGPSFCTPEIEKKIIGHTAKTLFHHKLKLLNESLKEEGKKSKASVRKLKILKHT